MTEQIAPASFDPLHAPLWRKLLAVRVLLLCLVGLALSFFFIGWLDDAKLDLPKWLQTGVALVAGISFLAFILALALGGADLVVHFVPEGRLKRLLLRGDRSPEAIATDFKNTGYFLSLLPFIITVALILVGAALLLFFGGVALVVTMFSAMFAGWPSWAIVITILLVAILLKK